MHNVRAGDTSYSRGTSRTPDQLGRRRRGGGDHRRPVRRWSVWASRSRSISPRRTPVVISTNISNVPYYAARSLLRMFIALTLSTVFTLVYGTAAARLRRAEKVLVPILDVLQSIPILVFLPIALTFFIKVFPTACWGSSWRRSSSSSRRRPGT